MPMLDRQERRPTPVPPSLAGQPPRSVPEVAPTPLQRHYVNLSVVALVAGAVAITALELGTPLQSPLVKGCVLVAAPILLLTTGDAALRIWRSAWAWMPINARRGLFRLAWFGTAVVFLVLIVAAAAIVLAA